MSMIQCYFVTRPPGTKTKEAMKCTGFNEVDIAFDTYHKHIKRLKKKCMTPHLSQIVVYDLPMYSSSILTTGSIVTATTTASIATESLSQDTYII